SLRNDWNKETSRYVFIPVDTHDVKETKNSFKKLCRACIPSHSVAETSDITSNPGHKVSSASFGLNRLTSSNKISRKKTSLNEPNHALTSNSFLKQIHESKWFDQIQLILSIANTIVEKIEEISSVMVCLEDGWDLTAQVVSLAELLLDPFYRTIDGFSLLIEREWLSMGHRFTRRNNHTADDQTGFAPIFIQFLDCVHQCLSQYPNAFEFNYFYLEFLAYHSVSNRFSTFLLDNEFERAQYGLLKTEPVKRTFSGERTHVTYRHYKHLSPDTKCIWDYILKVHYNSARFFNFNYQPGVFSLSALRPGSEMYKLKLWKYYVRDDLCTGPLYDYDLINTGSYLNSNGDTRHPVCVQSAGDYCEQLNELLPSQYEVLLKQIIVKYKMQRFESDCESDVNVYISSVLNKSSEEIEAAKEGFRINWKNLWDYFFDLAERKMLNDLLIEDDIGDYGNCFMSVTKPYLTSADETNSSSQLQMAHNKHLTLMSSHSHSSAHSASTNYSSSTSSATSSTPPFPNFKKSSSKPHEFEFFVFSSQCEILVQKIFKWCAFRRKLQ
ncbi:Myotubularin-related, partial [Brachionus plicatilis]